MREGIEAVQHDLFAGKHEISDRAISYPPTDVDRGAIAAAEGHSNAHDDRADGGEDGHIAAALLLVHDELHPLGDPLFELLPGFDLGHFDRAVEPDADDLFEHELERAKLFAGRLGVSI